MTVVSVLAIVAGMPLVLLLAVAHRIAAAGRSAGHCLVGPRGARFGEAPPAATAVTPETSPVVVDLAGRRPQRVHTDAA